MDDSDIQSESDVPQNNDKNDAKRRSETWFFEIIVRLRHDRNFSDLLKAREQEQQIGSCLDSASEISWARSQTESEIPGTPRLEGFVQCARWFLKQNYPQLVEALVAGGGND